MSVTILPELSTDEKAVLAALAHACNYSLGAHVPREAVQRRVNDCLKGDVKKILGKLRSKQLCYEHPTHGNMTWFLSRDGLNLAQELLKHNHGY